ncbi:hypothetical protein GF325_11135 [Candidatus Bathyarchaeota archaeon]|nr:hypothetical protein [Candidatus Bathyarchaeota archaeon]
MPSDHEGYTSPRYVLFRNAILLLGSSTAPWNSHWIVHPFPSVKVAKASRYRVKSPKEMHGRSNSRCSAFHSMGSKPGNGNLPWYFIGGHYINYHALN